ncbi:MAG: TetR/AcrR family transcriptional regulator [Rhizobium sp.]|nr:TetR/AcrR family transcriptional regulator [Rhizobium sp.]
MVTSPPKSVSDGVEKGSGRNDTVRREIFRRALLLIERKGFRATSMQDIADDCGLTKPGVYYYFQNKAALLEAVYNETTANFYAGVEEVSSSEFTATEALRRLIQLQVSASFELRQFQRVLMRERNEMPPEKRKNLARRERDYEAAIQKIVERGQDEGVFTGADSHTLSLTIVGFLNSMYNWSKFYQVPEENVVEVVCDLLLNGLLDRKKGAG